MSLRIDIENEKMDDLPKNIPPTEGANETFENDVEGDTNYAEMSENPKAEKAPLRR